MKHKFKYRPLQEAAALEQGAVGVDRAGPDQTCPLDRGKIELSILKAKIYISPLPPKKKQIFKRTAVKKCQNIQFQNMVKE